MCINNKSELCANVFKNSRKKSIIYNTGYSNYTRANTLPREENAELNYSGDENTLMETREKCSSLLNELPR